MRASFTRPCVMRLLIFRSGAGVREERVIRYMLNEMHKGKRFDQVVADAYVMNHTTSEARSRLVENPRIIAGIEDQMAGARYSYTVDHPSVRVAETE